MKNNLKHVEHFVFRKTAVIFTEMIFPDYTRVEKKFIIENDKTDAEFSHFMVFVDGYKVDVGFRIHRSKQKTNGLRVVDYSFERYGWSDSLLKWRSKEFGQKVVYLENFFHNAGKDKIDDFLFKDKKVIVEKVYRWPEIPIAITKFSR